MKKLLVLFSLLVFVGVYTAPALTMPKETAKKIVAVDKEKKVKATKTAQKACCEGAKADCCKDGKSGCSVGAKSSCCGEAKTSCCGASTTSCCTGTGGFSAACATACQGAAAIKGNTKTAEKK